ncbi:MAG: EAL domain-containing protein, partial [Acidobacteriota bacterium]
SSIAHLRRLSIDELKIDRSFVHDMLESADAEAVDSSIPETILALARGLGLDVVAEGVEHAQQLAALRRVGCQRIQGYLVSEPLPAAELLVHLRSDAPPWAELTTRRTKSARRSGAHGRLRAVD